MDSVKTYEKGDFKIRLHSCPFFPVHAHSTMVDESSLGTDCQLGEFLRTVLGFTTEVCNKTERQFL